MFNNACKFVCCIFLVFIIGCSPVKPPPSPNTPNNSEIDKTELKDQNLIFTIRGPVSKYVGETLENIAIGEGTGAIHYSSSDESIATVSELGTVSFISPGQAIISAVIVEDDIYKSAIAALNVTTLKYISTIEFEDTTSQNLTVFESLSNSANTNRSGTVFYSSSDNDIATVDADGTITAVGYGQVEITADIKASYYYSAASTTVFLSVERADNLLSFEKSGQSFSISTTDPFSNKAEHSGDDLIQYSSSASDIANVTATGNLTVQAAGTVTITASTLQTEQYNQASAFYTVTIAKSDRFLEFTYPETQSLTVFDVLSNSVKPGPDSTIATYTSNNPSVASVDPESGIVTAISSGNATISAQVDANSIYNPSLASYSISVERANPEIIFSDASALINLLLGDTFRNEANAMGNLPLHYTSSNEHIATIDQTGELTTAQTGRVTIEAYTEQTDIYEAASISSALNIEDLALHIEPSMKKLNFSWQDVSFLTSFNVYENTDGQSGYTKLGLININNSYSVNIELLNHPNASYVFEYCSDLQCFSSDEQFVSSDQLKPVLIGYTKSDSIEEAAFFGQNVELSSNGNIMVVGVPNEDSIDSSTPAGAVYTYMLGSQGWEAVSRLHPLFESNETGFGSLIAMSDDGKYLAISNLVESNTYKISIYQLNNFAEATYIDSFTQTYLRNLAISGDGSVIATSDNAKSTYFYNYVEGSNDWQHVQTITETDNKLSVGFGYNIELNTSGNLLTINDYLYDNINETTANGAVFIYELENSTWKKVQVIAPESGSLFGLVTSLSSDGNSILITDSRDIHMYQRDSTLFKVQNEGIARDLGWYNGNRNTLSGDGTKIAIMHYRHIIILTQVNDAWSETARIQVPNYNGHTRDYAYSSSLALSQDGSTLVVGASTEDSGSSDPDDNTLPDAGAVYTY